MLDSDTRRCPTCCLTKPRGEFYKNLANKNGLSTWCRPCTREYQRTRYTKKPRDSMPTRERRRRNNLAWKYGITHEAYDEMLAAQGGGCALCSHVPSGNERRLAVDHCHVTKRVRGLLCGRCNRALGLLRDDPALCCAAAEYLAA